MHETIIIILLYSFVQLIVLCVRVCEAHLYACRCSEREDNALKHDPRSSETELPRQLFVSTADPSVVCVHAHMYVLS